MARIKAQSPQLRVMVHCRAEYVVGIYTQRLGAFLPPHLSKFRPDKNQ